MLFQPKDFYVGMVENKDINNGFIKFTDLELNWTGKPLPATIMKLK